MDIPCAEIIYCLHYVTFPSNRFHFPTPLQLNNRTFLGDKCSQNALDNILKVPLGCDPALLSAATLEFDHHNPQKGDTAPEHQSQPGTQASSRSQTCTPTSQQPSVPSPFSDPTTSPKVQQNLLNELRHRLALCLLGDPFIRPQKHHPCRIQNLFMLIKLLRTIFHVQVDPFAFPGFVIERAEISMFHRYNMLLLCRGASMSHGKESPFAEAVNDWMKWDTRVVGNGATVLDAMQWWAGEIEVPLMRVIVKFAAVERGSFG